MNPLINYFNNQKQEFISFIRKLVEYRSYNGETNNINIFADFLYSLFSGFHPDIIERKTTPAGDILIIDYFTDFSKTIVLLSHMDTVKVEDNNPKAIIKDGKLFGNGSYDMKTGIALFYFLLKAIFQGEFKIDKRIRIILNPDEESGSKYSKETIYQFSKDAQAVLIPEPCCPDGGVKVKRKAIGKIDAIITGKAAHSGIEPEKGVDANRSLTILINKIDELVSKERGISFNPGIIEGGVRTNVVSPISKMRAEIRGFDTEQIISIMNQIKDIKNIGDAIVEIKTNLEHPALEKTDKNIKLYKIAKQAADNMGYKLPECYSGGASDGSTLSYKGIPVIDGIGIRGGGAHSIGEYIEPDDFPFRAFLIASIVKGL
jgi:glutamate carboxypeptidase